jgi:hypothetical protein
MKWGRYPVAVAVAVILRNEGSSIGYGKYPAAVAAASYQRLAFSFEKGFIKKYPAVAAPNLLLSPFRIQHLVVYEGIFHCLRTS